MNKLEFLNTLENKIRILPQKYVKGILDNYKEYFEDGMLDGKTEYQIAKELGNLDYIAHSILLEYYTENPQVIKNLSTFMKALNSLKFIGISSFCLLIGIPLIASFIVCYLSFYLVSFCFIVVPLALIVHLIMPNLPISFGTEILWQQILIAGIFVIIGIGLFKLLDKGRKIIFSYSFKLLTKKRQLKSLI